MNSTESDDIDIDSLPSTHKRTWLETSFFNSQICVGWSYLRWIVRRISNSIMNSFDATAGEGLSWQAHHSPSLEVEASASLSPACHSSCTTYSNQKSARKSKHATQQTSISPVQFSFFPLLLAMLSFYIHYSLFSLPCFIMKFPTITFYIPQALL